MSVNNGFSKGYPFTMAAATGSATVDLPEGFTRNYLQVSTLSSITAIDVYASADGGTTYYQLRHTPNGSTATVMAPTFIVTNSVMANGGLVPVPAGFKNYKFKCTDSNPSAALAFSLLCST